MYFEVPVGRQNKFQERAFIRLAWIVFPEIVLVVSVGREIPSTVLICLLYQPLAIEANHSKAVEFIREAASQSCDLAVLPEYHLTNCKFRVFVWSTFWWIYNIILRVSHSFPF